MANRRPPLFELLQKENASGQGRTSGSARPGVLGGASSASTVDANDSSSNGSATNGHAQGSLETKPATKPERLAKPTTKASTIADLPEPEAPSDQAAGNGVASATATARLAVRPEREPKREGEPAPAPSASPAGAADWSGMHPKSQVSVRMLWVYGAVAAVLVAIIGVWQLGYSLGGAHEKAEFEAYLRQSDRSTLVQDPIAQDAGVSPVERGKPRANQRASDRPELAAQPDPEPVEDRRAAPTEPVTTPAVGGMPAVDVLVDARQAGNNYLKLASGMGQARAKALAEHLSANGVPAMAIDEGRLGYGLYTAFAVPSGQYRAMSEQRREHEARVVRLLGTVPSDAGGPYTPRDQLWMRFDG